MTTHTTYGRSPWIAEFPKSRARAYPRLRGTLDSDVVIVGGGLTGCATAYAFAAHGVKATLIEAARIGRGSSGGAAGWISDDPGVSFAELERARGRRTARTVFQAWRRAALDFAALARRLGLTCRLESGPAVLVAGTPAHAGWLARERKARVAAGLEAPLLNARALRAETALEAPAAIRLRDGATLDPYRCAVGLAAAAVARGASIYETSPATRIRFDRRTAEVQTAGATIHTRRVIVATGAPTPLFRALARHFWFDRAYLALTAPVPPRIRQRLGARDAVIRDLAAPPHVLRWVDDERLLVAGADLSAPAERLREKLLIQRTGQLMYELSTLYPDVSGIPPAYGWDVAHTRTADGLPFIGPHRNYPHHLFAFGDSSRGVTGAYLASRILLRHHLSGSERSDQIFGFR